jgi:hypothetical protein
MMLTKWSRKILDDKRGRCDPQADEAVGKLFAAGQIDAVNDMMKTLVRNEDIPVHSLPPVIRDYLDATGEVPAADVEAIRAGQEVFELYGPEVLMVLGLYAIPAAYGARRGVQVLYRTAYFKSHPMRRVWETAQFVVDVMTDGGLGPQGRGIRSAQKVRLMHAAIRHIMRHDPTLPAWKDDDLGAPINQEDMAATLMEFSFVVLEGLRRLGIELSWSQQNAYLQAWLAVGRIMGVEPSSLPTDVDDARELTQAIAARQILGSPEGVRLTRDLIAGMRSTMPSPLEGFIPSAMRFFLEDDTITKKNVADMLSIPRDDWTRLLVEGAGFFGGLVADLAQNERHLALALRQIKLFYIRGLLAVERGSTRPRFRIPDGLLDVWNVGR